ncbi:MAG: hypothetical protein GY755_05755 [Chloroflexi bacterium]|nr:hypothetical protein [Chloroflexota bacterium]
MLGSDIIIKNFLLGENQMANFIEQFLGFIIGIVGNWIFLYLVFFIKPRIVISKKAVYNPEDDRIRIKIINKGRRQAINIQANLFIGEYQVSPLRGWDIILKRLPLSSNTRQALGVKNASPWDIPNIFTFRVSNAHKILERLNKTLPEEYERRLIFNLSATDAVSGATFVRRVTYKLTDIVEGEYGKKCYLSLPLKMNRITQKNKLISELKSYFILFFSKLETL